MTMRIYVGTYAKYNSGSIEGAWLDLEDYSDKEEFEQACKELHKNEEDPEFMFQDFEGIPEGMISESFVSPEVFEIAQMDGDDVELLKVYRKHVNQEGSIEEAQESFRGTYDSPKDYAFDLWEETYNMDSIPSDLRNAIDWEDVARDMSFGDTSFVAHEGKTWVFTG